MEIKYTADGKKVVVIGKLNNSESIVQEIHVSDDGTELPAGDNFVASNLLNAPMKTWKENRIGEIDKKYDAALVKWEEELHEKKKKHEASLARLQNKIEQTNFLYDNLNIEPFRTLIDFMENRITHFVRDDYGRYSILEFDDVMCANDNYDRHDIKLLTLYGYRWVSNNQKLPATFSYTVSEYADGSGSKYSLYPAASYEECIEIIKNLLVEEYKNNGNKLDGSLVSNCEEYKLKIFPESELNAFWKEKCETFQQEIVENEKKYSNKKSELENKLNEFREKIKE